MSYIINKTDGSVLTEIVDGTVDQTATDLTLVGKNASSYGEAFNENFVHLLENFANTSAPNNPIQGQLWFDTSESRLKIYDGAGFKVSGGSIVSNTIPSTIGQGDIWIDSRRKQLYFNDGVSTILAGPPYSTFQGITGCEVVDITDTNNNPRTIILFKVGGILLGIFSNTQFTPSIDGDGLGLEFQGPSFNTSTNYIRGDRVIYRSNPNTPPTYIYEAITASVPSGTLPTDIEYWKQVTISPGFNASTLGNLKFDVTTTRANALVDGNGDLKTADNFISNSGDASINGTLTLTNVVPLILGGSTQSQVTVSNALFELASNISDQNFQVSSKNAANGLQASMFVNARNEYVGIYTNTPTATLDVNGDTRIRGSLTVEKNITAINQYEVNIEEKLLSLGKTASADNSTANGGGILLEGGLDGDKTLLWSSTVPGWSSSENFNIASSKGYFINGIQILNYTTIGSSVVNSNLTGVGILRTLQVYSNSASCGTTIDGNTISYTSNNYASGDVVLLPKGTGNVSVSNRKITNVSNAQDAADAVNLQTTQALISSAPLGLSADTAFLAGPTLNADIATQIIEKIYPAITHGISTECRIWCIDLGIAKLYTISALGVWGWSADL
jgi:hypothetical protein